MEHDLFRKPVSTFRDHALALLEIDALVGPLQIDVERLAQAIRIVPHAAEHRELDDLPLGKVLPHRLERGPVVARRHVGHDLGPADRGLVIEHMTWPGD